MHNDWVALRPGGFGRPVSGPGREEVQTFGALRRFDLAFAPPETTMLPIGSSASGSLKLQISHCDIRAF
jgi:hypothetical protein